MSDNPKYYIKEKRAVTCKQNLFCQRCNTELEYKCCMAEEDHIHGCPNCLTTIVVDKRYPHLEYEELKAAEIPLSAIDGGGGS